MNEFTTRASSSLSLMEANSDSLLVTSPRAAKKKSITNSTRANLS